MNNNLSSNDNELTEENQELSFRIKRVVLNNLKSFAKRWKEILILIEEAEDQIDFPDRNQDNSR